MAPKFGTSGLRGLVSQLTDTLVNNYVRAFLVTCDHGGTIWIGEDLRPSSGPIAAVVARTVVEAGYDVVLAGPVPTPALALAAQGAGAVMVTGSHIPADRNGLKFYTRRGEISKVDEVAITGALGQPAQQTASGVSRREDTVGDRFVTRYIDAFGHDALSGHRIGVYTHSAVGRDLLTRTLSGLGAETVELGRSDVFIPVDTEAVSADTRAELASWIAMHNLDAIASTDGDSDRPMLTDETGRVIPGDLLGQITSTYLEAETVVTPISSNSSVMTTGAFTDIQFTKIGSPHVISGIEAAQGRVVGYEANGGFLLGFEATPPKGRPLAPLVTRDSFLPIVVPLIACPRGGLATRAAREAVYHTAADRLQNMDSATMDAFVTQLANTPSARAALLEACGLSSETALDLTDGVRISEVEGHIVHVRPSGNAPELRIYVEAPTRAEASAILARAVHAITLSTN